MTYTDQFYQDASNAVHWLSAEDQENAAAETWAGAPLPNPAWTAITAQQAQAILNPPPTLAQAQATQIALLNAAYNAAITAPVSFKTAAGTTASFPQTDVAKTNLQRCIEAGQSAWSLNLWLDVNGTPVSPFTYADLQGLAAAMESAEEPEFVELLALIAQVNAATTVSAVQAIVWPAS